MVYEYLFFYNKIIYLNITQVHTHTYNSRKTKCHLSHFSLLLPPPPVLCFLERSFFFAFYEYPTSKYGKLYYL